MSSTVPSRASLASLTTPRPESSSARMRRMAMRSSSSDISSTGVPEPSVSDAVATEVDDGAVSAAKAGAVRRRAGVRAVAATSRAPRVSLIREPALWVRVFTEGGVRRPGYPHTAPDRRSLLEPDSPDPPSLPGSCRTAQCRPSPDPHVAVDVQPPVAPEQPDRRRGALAEPAVDARAAGAAPPLGEHALRPDDAPALVAVDGEPGAGGTAVLRRGLCASPLLLVFLPLVLLVLLLFRVGAGG